MMELSDISKHEELAKIIKHSQFLGIHQLPRAASPHDRLYLTIHTRTCEDVYPDFRLFIGDQRLFEDANLFSNTDFGITVSGFSHEPNDNNIPIASPNPPVTVGDRLALLVRRLCFTPASFLSYRNHPENVEYDAVLLPGVTDTEVRFAYASLPAFAERKTECTFTYWLVVLSVKQPPTLIFPILPICKNVDK